MKSSAYLIQARLILIILKEASMKKQLSLLLTLGVLLTGCENYTSPQGGTGGTSGGHTSQQGRGTTDTTGRQTREQNPNQPGNPDMNRNSQGR
jgi:hypothetical protein